MVDMRQPSQRQYAQRPDGVIGKPGGVVGNGPAQIAMLLSVLLEAAPARDIAARALVMVSGGKEELVIRRARPEDFRARAISPETVAARFTVACNGVASITGTFAEVRDQLARLPMLTGAKWSLVDLAACASVLADGG